MIQLNLKRNDVQGLKMQSSVPDQDKEVPVFSIPEITLEGECQVSYTIQKNQRYGAEEDEQTPFNVTKTINFNKCERTADLSYGYQTNPAEELRCFNCLRQQKAQQQVIQIEKILELVKIYVKLENQFYKFYNFFDLFRSKLIFKCFRMPFKSNNSDSEFANQYVNQAKLTPTRMLNVQLSVALNWSENKRNTPLSVLQCSPRFV